MNSTEFTAAKPLIGIRNKGQMKLPEKNLLIPV